MEIKILVTRERLRECLSPEEYFEDLMEGGRLLQKYRILKKFMVDETGQYLTPEQAGELLRNDVNLEDFMRDSFPKFFNDLKNVLVSPMNAGS